ncbi:MAG: KTSC domain-containing protein [Bacteroidetes bacterium]|nr:KTSC domain-containing protein [Bacteroidota bacterium]
MKRITDYRKLFNISKETSLSELKVIYRNLMKEWHPDKFLNDDILKSEAETKSKIIIEAYHFLVSISPETHASTLEDYTLTTTTSGIDDFLYKGQTLKITFQNGSKYEYFGVPKNTYNKLINSGNLARFARRHVFGSYIYRNVFKPTAL